VEVVRATWRNGQIVPDGPVDWPEGSRLVVERELAETGATVGCDEDWSDAPDSVVEWLAWYDSLEPLEITPEEEADLAEWRRKVKEYCIANMHKGIEGLSE